MESYTIRVIAPIDQHQIIIDAVGVDPAIIGNQMFWADTTKSNVDKIESIVRKTAPNAVITIGSD